MRRIAAAITAGVLLIPLGTHPAAASTPAATPVVASTGLVFGPSTLDFGSVSPNSGPTAPLETGASFGSQVGPAFYNFNIVGPDAGDFYVTQNFCGHDPWACGIYVAFDPDSTPGPRSATLQIYDAASNSPQSVALKGSISVADMTLSTTQLNLGGTNPGTSSSPQSVTVTSTGTGPLNISQISISEVGTWVQFNLTQDCTGHPIEPGNTCNISVSFTPSLASGFYATISIVSDAAGYHAVTVSGFGAATTFSWAGSLDFRSLNVPSTRTMPVTVNNLGISDLVVSSDIIGGADAAKFTIGSDTCVTGPIHAGGFCEIDVTAHATTTGTFNATLTANDNSSAGPHVMSLVMHGVNTSDSFSATSLDFGTVNPGQQVDLPLTITNNGPDTLSLFSFTVSSTHPPDFSAATYMCFDIAPTSSCTITVYFVPYYLTGVNRTGTLTIVDSTGTHQIGLSATANGWGFGFSTDPMNFGTVTKGSSVTLSQTISNTGNQSMTINPLSNGGNSSLTVSNDSCSNATLAPSATCTFSLTFNPCCMGDQSGIFYVGTGTSFAFFHFTATGVAPSFEALYFNTFPDTPWHTTSAPLTVTFKNSGNANWHVTSIAPADTTNFSVAPGSDHCSGMVVAPSSTCTIAFLFSPNQAIHLSSNINVVSDAPEFGPPFHEIDGVGTASWAGFRPNLAFGSYEIGQSSTQTIAVRNIQEAALHVTNASFSSPGAGFSLVSQTCQNVPRGGACELSIQFAPSVTGPASTVMTLVDDEVSPRTVTLTGKGLVHAACQAATLTASTGGTAAVGNLVVFNATSTTCALPQYQFRLQPSGGSWTTVQDWSGSITWTWNTAGLALGSYSVEVRVRDQLSDTSPPAAYETNATTTEQLTTPPCSAAGVEPDRLSPAQIGSTIVLTGSAETCGTPNYQFWLQVPGSVTWDIVQPYSSSPSFMWNSTGMPAGTYHFSVWARDSHSAGTSHNSSGSWDAYAPLDFILTVYPSCNLLTVTVSPFGYATAGQTVNVDGAVRYCSAPEFEFWLLAPGSTKWALAKAYSFDPIFPGFTWNTNGYVGGTYQVAVWAKDASSPGVYHNSMGSWDTATSFSYYLQPVHCQTLDVSGSFIGPGKFQLWAYATGCQNPRYEFWVKYPGSKSYKLFRSYSSAPNAVFTFTGKPSGRYYFSIWARDASSPWSYDVAFVGYVDW